VSILNVIRPLILLAPFLEAVGGHADKSGSAGLIEHWIVVIYREGFGLELEEGCRDFATLGRADGDRWRVRDSP
jgi:hypothetical protein